MLRENESDQKTTKTKNNILMMNSCFYLFEKISINLLKLIKHPMGFLDSQIQLYCSLASVCMSIFALLKKIH